MPMNGPADRASESMQLPAPFLEERNNRFKSIERFDAVAGVIAPARMHPARIAVLPPRGECHNLGAPLRPAAAFQRDIEREKDFME